MKYDQLVKEIKSKGTFLCVGLDPDLTKIPQHLLQHEDPIFEFNKEIIKATSDHCVAYKPNTAFYEAYGIQGMVSLQKTIDFLNENYPSHFTIADAKRGDIGNTSSMYAKAFLQTMNFDAITVAPYMGSDSVKPFLDMKDKWVILLALTSNEGAFDFQTLDLSQGKKLFEQVIETSLKWGTKENLMYVVGATKAEMLSDIRKIIPNHFLLVPGVGAQGGSLSDVCKHGLNTDCGLLINSSRGILYAGNQKDFALLAEKESRKISEEMRNYL